MYASATEREAEDGRASGEGWRRSLGSIVAILSLRARYQYYHNFTFVIGWHRASMTQFRAPCLSPFLFLSLSLLSVLPRTSFLLWFVPSLLALLSLRLFLSLSLACLLSFSPSYLTTPCHDTFSLPSFQLPHHSPATHCTLFTRFWSLFVTSAIVP